MVYTVHTVEYDIDQPTYSLSAYSHRKRFILFSPISDGYQIKFIQRVRDENALSQKWTAATTNRNSFFFYSSSTQTHEWIYWKSIVIVWTNNLIGAHELLDGSHLSPNRIEIPYSLDSFTSPRRATAFISGVSFFRLNHSRQTRSIYILLTRITLFDTIFHVCFR